MKAKFYDVLDFEKYTVKAMRTGSYVTTFRVPKMSEFLNKNIEQFRELIAKEVAAKENMDLDEDDENIEDEQVVQKQKVEVKKVVTDNRHKTEAERKRKAAEKRKSKQKGVTSRLFQCFTTDKTGLSAKHIRQKLSMDIERERNAYQQFRLAMEAKQRRNR